MKQFPRIISKLYYEPLVLLPEKHSAICQVIEAHMHGAGGGRPMILEDDDGEGDDSGFTNENYQEIGNTAVIRMEGVIEKHMKRMASAAPGCDLDGVNDMISVAERDRDIERIIFDFRTPGGTVTGVPETGRKILQCTKETIAFCDDQCCSGGIWLAAQCQRFYATGSARIGSVGVWCAYLDLSRKMENEGQNMQAISAGKHKLLGAYWKTMTPEERQIIQANVDKIYTQFKAAMNSVRTVSEESMGNGLVFDGEEAAERGLTDGVVEDMGEILEDMV